MNVQRVMTIEMMANDALCGATREGEAVVGKVPPPREAASKYLRRGWRVVPIPPRMKGPVLTDWQLLRLEEHQFDGHFGDDTNIGLLLGEPSGGLVDVDCDCEEAKELAEKLLPQTPAITGRGGNPRSHRWYVAPGVATRQFRDPITRAMIIELRSTGGQTVVGPSVHPEGDRYDMLEAQPADVDGDALLRAVEQIHREVVLARYGEIPEPPKRNGPAGASVSANQSRVPTSPHDLPRLEARAMKYLAKMPHAISGQGGHDATYAAATVLVHGFGLPRDTALAILEQQYNLRCEPPWSRRELEHKVNEAEKKPHDLPYGWLRDQERPMSQSTLRLATADTAHPNVGENTDADGLISLGTRDPASKRLVLSPKRTLPTARAYVREFNHHADARTLHGHGGLVVEWRDNRYVEVEDEAIRHNLQPWLHEALRYVKNPNTKEFELAPFESNPTTVNAALDSIRSFVHLPASRCTPSWLDGAGEGLPPALEILPCKSMNLHIPTGRVLPATPKLFTFNALDFDYDPNPEPPERWIKFLEQVFGDDIESMELLQDWMGYCLTSDTRQQKMLLLVGPRRSGKGTIGRILTRLIGAANVAGPTTSSLASQFGLQPLIGKSLAIVSDARFTGEGVPIVAERLLCISGEDTLTIDRKFLGAVSMKLPTRFMFLTNELPRFSDASNALAGRFVVLKLQKSFYGNEDHGLLEALLGELPGILKWSLDGWARLQSRRKFIQPASSLEAIQEMEDLCSPVSAFVREKCKVQSGLRIYIDVLYREWQEWCEREGRSSVTTKQTFGRDLTAAFPTVARRRGTNQNFYEGITLA